MPPPGSRLDRDYPLWKYWLVRGLSDGRWALISKIHHCMARTGCRCSWPAFPSTWRTRSGG
ncbi:MAG TPA: wax ester/triacylglycerol synthase domain-containing protein [Streptosporangiaceae bacterium]|nr:wax ester/triacylglycerol synthase domain-containing protein [Streptosporangiaceae bacterium]